MSKDQYTKWQELVESGVCQETFEEWLGGQAEIGETE